MDNNIFSAMEIDAIGEILNISLGASATAVSNMLDKPVGITTPRVQVYSIDEFNMTEFEPAVGVEITYVTGLDGKNVMILKRTDVKAIVETLMFTKIPDDEFVLDELNMSAVCEVMNQMMGASATALAEFLGEPVDISTPVSFEVANVDEFKNKYFSQTDPMVVVSFDLSIEDIVKSEFLSIMTIDLAKKIMGMFDLGPSDDEIAPEPTPEPVVAPEPVQVAPPPVAQQPVMEQPVAPMPMQQPVMDQQMMQQGAPTVQPTMEQWQMMQQMMGMMNGQNQTRVINAQPLEGSPGRTGADLNAEQAENLDMIMGVGLQVSVEIGRTRKQVKDILEFTQGSLVVLDKLAGDTVDLYVNGQCIAKGDVVVVDDSFGVKITEIIKDPKIAFFK